MASSDIDLSSALSLSHTLTFLRSLPLQCLIDTHGIKDPLESLDGLVVIPISHSHNLLNLESRLPTDKEHLSAQATHNNTQ